MCVCVKLLSHVQLCNPMDCSPVGSSVHGILRQEYWNALPFPSQGDLPNRGIEPEFLKSLVLSGKFFTSAPPAKPSCSCTLA